jgi:hypothetical protein
MSSPGSLAYSKPAIAWGKVCFYREPDEGGSGDDPTAVALGTLAHRAPSPRKRVQIPTNARMDGTTMDSTTRPEVDAKCMLSRLTRRSARLARDASTEKLLKPYQQVPATEKRA